VRAPAPVKISDQTPLADEKSSFAIIKGESEENYYEVARQPVVKLLILKNLPSYNFCYYKPDFSLLSRKHYNNFKKYYIAFLPVD
jgi:hypothetical protein